MAQYVREVPRSSNDTPVPNTGQARPKRRLPMPKPKKDPATGANAVAVKQDATEESMAKRSRLEPPESTSQTSQTSQAETRQSEGKPEDSDLQRRKEEDQKREKDVFSRVRQQLPDLQKHHTPQKEDVKTVVEDERILPHGSPTNPSASSSVPVQCDDEKGGRGVAAPAPSSVGSVGNLEALWLGLGTEAPSERTSSAAEVEKSTVDHEDVPEKELPDLSESTMEPLPKETEDESPLEIFEELPAETAQLSGNDDVNVGNAGEGKFEEKDVEQQDPRPSEFPYQQQDPRPSDPPENTDQHHQDQDDQVQDQDQVPHPDVHQVPLQFQSDVHEQRDSHEFEADDSCSKVPCPDLTPKSADSHFPWDADELVDTAAPKTGTSSVTGTTDRWVPVPNDTTPTPTTATPKTKRRKRHDEAWDPAEDSSGEEHPEADHAEENSEDEVAERLWRRVEEEEATALAPEMLIEEEAEDWDPEAPVEQAPAAPSTWVSMEDDEMVRVDDVEGIPEPLKQMNSDLLEFGRSVCLGNLKNMCIVNLEEWLTFYEDMQEDLEKYCSKFGEVLFVGAEKTHSSQNPHAKCWVHFACADAAVACQSSMHKRIWGGNRITAKLWP